MLRRRTVCPWHLGPIPSGLAVCPDCGRNLVVDGAAVRPVDVQHEAVLADQRRAFANLLRYGVPAALVLGLLLQPAHAFAALAAPLLAGVHLLALRLFLVRRGYALLGPARRLFNRWLLRLGFLWLGLPGWGLASVPFLGVVTTPLVFAGLSAAAHHYTLVGVERERRRLPLYLWEKVLLGLLVAATLAGIVLLVALGGLVWLLVRELTARVAS